MLYKVEQSFGIGDYYLGFSSWSSSLVVFSTQPRTANKFPSSSRPLLACLLVSVLKAAL